MTTYDGLSLATDNPCDDPDCGGTIGADWVLCETGSCFGIYCRPCGEAHQLKAHIGPHEQAILASWKLDAEQRKLKRMTRRTEAPEMDAQDFFAAEVLRWPEKTLQKHVLELAAGQHWTHRYHTYFSDRSEKGFPDVVLARPETHQIVFAELKAQKGKLTPAQESWIEALRAAEGDGTVRVCIWRPCCWVSGEIERVLFE